jgi:hypothetical protein
MDSSVDHEGKPRWSRPQSYVSGQRPTTATRLYDKMACNNKLIVPVESVLSKCSKYETLRVIAASMVTCKALQLCCPEAIRIKKQRA